ncbi:hypothetical protein O9929_04495 [Vibrio lentus]|nr:hypothetical protein [Vibrio lentus]
MLTGEPLPNVKSINDGVSAGTITGDGSLIVEAHRHRLKHHKHQLFKWFAKHKAASQRLLNSLIRSRRFSYL